MDEKKSLQKSELERKYKLPKFEHTFNLEPIKGDRTGVSFDGLFKCKVLTLDEEAAYLSEKDSWGNKLSNGNGKILSDGLLQYMEMRSFLKFAIIEAPEWWWDFQENFLDMNVLTEVYFLARRLKEKLNEMLLQDKKELVTDESKPKK